MRLLIITQVIDTEHPILGFFHRWVEEFAKHYEQVHVICLQEGRHRLPNNVTVHSLGKEQIVDFVAGENFMQSISKKSRYTLRFFRLVWHLRHNYDDVFVHMNQVYVILGAPFWRAVGKRVGLWYAHGTVSLSLRVAVILAHTIFTSTEQGMKIETRKRKLVGQGIDTAIFKKISKQSSARLRLITVGRLSQSKNIDTLLKACAELKARGVPFQFEIIGSATTADEEVYAQKIKLLAHNMGLAREVTWVGPVSQSRLPTYLQSADVFIHDGSTNSLDKALLEAVFCGCTVVSSNPAYQAITKALAPTLLFPAHDSVALTSILLTIFDQSIDQRGVIMGSVYTFVNDSYSISQLVSGIVSEYKNSVCKCLP